MAQLPLQIDIMLGGRLTVLPGFGWLISRVIALQMEKALQSQISGAFTQLGIDINVTAETKSTKVTRRNRHPFAAIEYELNLEVQDYMALKGKIPRLPAMVKGKVTSALTAQIDRGLVKIIKDQLISQLPAQIKTGLSSPWLKALEVEARAG